MSVENNIALAKRYIGMWDNTHWKWHEREDWSPFLDVYHSDCKIHYASEEIRGIDEFRKGFSAVFAAFPDLSGDVVEIFGDGDYVAMRFAYTGTHENAFFGVPASGKRIDVTGTGIYRFEGGKVAEVWVNDDALGLMSQIQG